MPVAPPAPAAGVAASLHDRIYEAYYGKMGGPAFMRETQERINWLCEQVVGERILDVGTSQGIVPILLAREGRRVLGIDRDGKAISEAKTFLADEEPSTQRCVEFVQGDFLSLGVESGPFDTVILSEVLEHLLRPRDFVAKAVSLLQPQGCLLITVPFGINDWIDHKRTYYLSGILDNLTGIAHVRRIRHLGPWIGVAASRSVPDRPFDLAAALPELEMAFQQRERAIVDKRTELTRRIEDTSKARKDDAAQIAKLRDVVQSAQAAEKSALSQLAECRSQIERLSRQIDELERQSRAAAAETNAARESALVSQGVEKQLRIQLQEMKEAQTARARDHATLLAQHEREIQAVREDGQAFCKQVREGAAADIARLTQAELAIRSERDEGAKRIAALEAQLAQLHIALQAMTEDARQAKTAQEPLRKQAAQEAAAKQAAQATITLLTQQVNKLQETYAQLQVSSEARASALQADLLQSERRVGQIQADIAAARTAEASRIADLQLQLQAQRQLAESASERLLTAQAECTAAQNRAAGLEQELAVARADSTAKLARIADQEHQLVALRSEILNFTERIGEVVSQRDAERGRNATLAKELTDLQAGSQLARARIADLEQRLGDQHREAAASAELLRFAQAACTAEQNRNAALGQALADARSAQERTQQALDAAERDVLLLRAERDELSRERDDRRRDHDAQQAESSALRQRMVDQSAESQRKIDAIIEESGRERKDHRQRIATLEHRIATLVELGSAEERKNAGMARQLAEQEAASDRTLHELQAAMAATGERESQHKANLAALTKAHLEAGALLFAERAKQQMDLQEAPLFSRLGRLMMQVERWCRTPITWPLRGRRPGSHGGKVSEPAPSPAHRSPAPPKPSGPAKALRHLRVAAILDPFSSASFGPECDLVQLLPDSWQSQVSASKPDLLLVESAWQGKDDAWQRRIAQRSQALLDVVAWCRAQGIPSVFWNKEDPVHFDTFLGTASLFDHVCTTDLDCIPRYRRLLRHDRVHLLPFACQPRVHNPIEKHARKDAFCFAGAYYVRYPERARILADFLASLPAFRPVDIFDRNLGKDDPNYQFPTQFKPFIVGSLRPDDIDKAYKGYRYGINLNSITQSPSMFARRIFELLASNTLTISNYSRGVRLFFGDLVIMGDHGGDMVSRLRSLTETDNAKRRLMALRSVMRQHTYQDRLTRIAQIANIPVLEPALPAVIVVAQASGREQADRLLAAFDRQSHRDKRLVLLVGQDFKLPKRDDVRLVSSRDGSTMPVADLLPAGAWLAPWLAGDHYGPHYLTDLILATRYSDAAVIGKVALHRNRDGVVELHQPQSAYRPARQIDARCAIARADALPAQPLTTWIAELATSALSHPNALAADPFHYCRDGAGLTDAQQASCEDIVGLDIGAPLSALDEFTKRGGTDSTGRDIAATLPGADFAACFAACTEPVKAVRNGTHLSIISRLPEGKHTYCYDAGVIDPAVWRIGGDSLRLHLQASPELDLGLTLLFLDASQQRLGSAILPPNRDHTVAIPVGTLAIRIGMRIKGPGRATVAGLILGHRVDLPSTVITTAPILLVTNQYPSHDDLYRNAFVHRRVLGYRERGLHLDVMRVRPDLSFGYHAFEGVDCISGNEMHLEQVLQSGSHRTILVHFLDEGMWNILQRFADRIRIVVWVHGFEIQSYDRRAFSYTTDQERRQAQQSWTDRKRFWSELLTRMPANLHLVFVSRWLAETALADLGVKLPADRVSIIPNPIDTNLFRFKNKPADQRFKILSIRPFASSIYANDLTVQAILHLAKEPVFEKLHFRIIGKGSLFETTVRPLRKFANVVLEERFLSQREIAELHLQYGVFLCPSRMDSQGVSRDEAMASGLVPVTTAVGAIPEFVGPGCGMTVPADDSAGLAKAIREIALNPQLFLEMSVAASAAVGTRKQSIVKDQELAIIKGSRP